MHRAYIVVGPESSGTKMLTKLMVNAGCFGNAGPHQPLDKFISGESKFNSIVSPEIDKLVLRRSVPWGQGWPNLEEIEAKFKEIEWPTFWIILSRDWRCLAKSKVGQRHKLTLRAAQNWVGYEHLYIFDFLLKNRPAWMMLDASLIFKVKEKAFIRLSEVSGLKFDCSFIFDADAKYE